jgi:SAM-dependent methyltransferase
MRMLTAVMGMAVQPERRAGYASGVADGDAVDWRALNRASWDDRVPVHQASDFYDLDGFRAGASSLRPFEVAEAGDVTGRRLVHLQCHVGLDTLSWARNGALVTGLDFSEPAIEAARSLAASLAIDASFVAADVYDAVTALGGRRFDMVYTGTGALVWLPDLPRWASVVAALLEPGGFLYLVEAHPFAQILDDAGGATIVADYFHDQPRVQDYPCTYTDGPPLTHTRKRPVPASARADRDGAGGHGTADRLPERARLRRLPAVRVTRGS